MTALNDLSFRAANGKNVPNALDAPGIQAIEEEKSVALVKDTDIMIMDAAAVKSIKPLFAENPKMKEKATCKTRGLFMSLCCDGDVGHAVQDAYLSAQQERSSRVGENLQCAARLAERKANTIIGFCRQESTDRRGAACA